MFQGVAFILIGYFAGLPSAVSTFLYVLGGVKILLSIVSITIKTYKNYDNNREKGR